MGEVHPSAYIRTICNSRVVNLDARNQGNTRTLFEGLFPLTKCQVRSGFPSLIPNEVSVKMSAIQTHSNLSFVKKITLKKWVICNWIGIACYGVIVISRERVFATMEKNSLFAPPTFFQSDSLLNPPLSCSVNWFDPRWKAGIAANETRFFKLILGKVVWKSSFFLNNLQL